MACLTWLPNSKERSRPTSNRLRKLKKLQLLTWPSSGKLNKSLRRLKREQSLPWCCKQIKQRNLNPLPARSLEENTIGNVNPYPIPLKAWNNQEKLHGAYFNCSKLLENCFHNFSTIKF